MDTEASRKLVLDYLAAQGAGDGARIAELLDENVRWTPPESAGLGRPTGRDAVMQTMAEAGLLNAAGVDVIVVVAADDIFRVNFAEMQLLTNNTPQNLLLSFQWSMFLQQITQPLVARLVIRTVCFLL